MSPCQQVLEYVDYPLQKKKRVLGITLNCIWWGPQVLEIKSVEYRVIAITSRPTLMHCGRLWVKMILQIICIS